MPLWLHISTAQRSIGQSQAARQACPALCSLSGRRGRQLQLLAKLFHVAPDGIVSRVQLEGRCSAGVCCRRRLAACASREAQRRSGHGEARGGQLNACPLHDPSAQHKGAGNICLCVNHGWHRALKQCQATVCQPWVAQLSSTATPQHAPPRRPPAFSAPASLAAAARRAASSSWYLQEWIGTSQCEPPYTWQVLSCRGPAATIPSRC